MNLETIKVLTENPPPPKPMPRAAEQIQAIGRMEAELGLPRSRATFNVRANSERVKELSAMVAAKKSAATPAAVATAARASGPTLAVLREMETAVFGNHAGNYNDPPQKQVAAIARRIYESNLTVPGLDFKSLAAAGAWKNETTGAARSVRALEQSKIDAFFNPEK